METISGENIKKYKIAVAETALQLFINQLSVVDNCRIDYVSERNNVSNLMVDCIRQAQLFVEAVMGVHPINYLYNTDAERVGKPGEANERPA